MAEIDVAALRALLVRYADETSTDYDDDEAHGTSTAHEIVALVPALLDAYEAREPLPDELDIIIRSFNEKPHPEVTARGVAEHVVRTLRSAGWLRDLRRDRCNLTITDGVVTEVRRG